MNIRKKICMVVSIFLVISLITGCNKNSYTIKFAPEKGREYRVEYNVKLQSEDENVSIKNNFDINLRCTDIKKKNTYIDLKYNDYVIDTKEDGISIKADENSEIFGENIRKLKSGKFKGCIYAESNLLKYNLISGDEEVLGDSTLSIEKQQEKIIEIITCFIGENVKKNGRVNVNLEKIIGKEICKYINFKDTSINGQVEAIKNNIALIEVCIDESKNNNIKIKLSSQLNIETGMIRYMKLNIDDKSKETGRKTLVTDIFIEEE
ncbi:putative secreted protein [Clostridium bornimense]|uniref:Putative secreted protein n=1 Tax=Clostridium bornimense TaxID=1216932 RepID=W6SJ69_9CLOT|nr:hypothetical protein [Clostridium bornimense]CDM69730.1 putative secreted protein [Clostridium bornimense]